MQHRDLQRERVTENKLNELGLANLRKIANRSLEIHSAKGIFIALMGGDFEASLLLLDELWDVTLREAVSGDYVVAIPYREDGRWVVWKPDDSS